METKVKKGKLGNYSNIDPINSGTINDKASNMIKGKKSKRKTAPIKRNNNVDDNQVIAEAMKERNGQTINMKNEFKQNEGILDTAKKETMAAFSAVEMGNQIIIDIKEIFSKFNPDRNGHTNEHREYVLSELGNTVEILQEKNRENLKFIISLIEHICEIKNELYLHNANKMNAKREVGSSISKTSNEIKKILTMEYARTYNRDNNKKGRQHIRN